MIGFGRVVGDGGIICVASDIYGGCRVPAQGYAGRIMQAIDGYPAKIRMRTAVSA